MFELWIFQKCQKLWNELLILKRNKYRGIWIIFNSQVIAAVKGGDTNSNGSDKVVLTAGEAVCPIIDVWRSPSDGKALAVGCSKLGAEWQIYVNIIIALSLYSKKIIKTERKFGIYLKKETKIEKMIRFVKTKKSD